MATVIFDLEQGRGFGYGLGDTAISGYELAMTWDETNGYLRWRGGEGRALVSFLRGADVVVGFNCLAYDYRVLGGYLHERERTLVMAMLKTKTVDLFIRVKYATFRGYGLDALGQSTLGLGKLQSPDSEADEEGRWDYLERDVELTRDLYQHIKTSGWVETPDGVYALTV